MKTMNHWLTTNDENRPEQLDAN